MTFKPYTSNYAFRAIFILICLAIFSFPAISFAYDNSSTVTDVSTSDPTISNSGNITGGNAITSNGVSVVVTNSGSLIGLNHGILNQGTISSLTNSGLIQSTGDTAIGNNFLTDTITNTVNGRIIGKYVGIWANGPITNLINSGWIEGIGSPYGAIVMYFSPINNITNNVDGNITGSSGILVGNNVVLSIINAGSIIATSGDAILVPITGGINLVTNTGTISATGGYGINNAGSMPILNNAQGAGNSRGALTYKGALPTNYNVIINGITNYGQLAVTSATGNMAFGIAPGSTVNANGKYVNVLQGFRTLGSVTSTTGTYNTYSYSLFADGTMANAWDLCFGLCNITTNGPNPLDTQTTLTNNLASLQGAFNLQTSIINNGLSYDCSLFDVHGLCISTGGRITNTNTPTGDSTGALVIGGYRVNDHVRIGAYLDQGVSSSTPTGINLKQHNPLFGAYGVWQARQDGLGAQVKVAAGYNDSDMTVTRAVVGTSEAGSGSTSLTSQAVSVVGSYGVEMQGSWIASPYVGIRYTDVKAPGYTEASSTSVTAPLSYASLSQSTTSLLAGIRWSGKLTDRVGLNGSVGVEQDVSNNNSSYTATGVDGLTPIVFNTDVNKTRPVASIGTTVSIDKRQQLAFSVFYSEQAFSKSSTTSAYGTYTIGF